jgi:hypothetical protein
MGMPTILEPNTDGQYIDEYLKSEYDVARCTFKLLESTLFKAHMEYVRRQIVYGLLQVSLEG